MAFVRGEIAREVLPWVREYKDGTIERLMGYEKVPSGLDPRTGVLSKDVLVVPETNVSARFYLPKLEPGGLKRKLPLMVYFPGGAFLVATPAEPYYHTLLNLMTAESNVLAVSVDYRLAPEHPLPTAYDDSWAVLQWVFSHVNGGGQEDWLKEYADFDRVFLAGDSAGANVAHHMAMRIAEVGLTREMKLAGALIVHPYFWGKEPIGVEVNDPLKKSLVDSWWLCVCPSDKGCDDPLINPFVDGAPSLAELVGDSVLVCAAGNDILRDRARLYYEKLKTERGGKVVELIETEGEDHVFHLFNPNTEAAENLIKQLGSFVNQ